MRRAGIYSLILMLLLTIPYVYFVTGGLAQQLVGGLPGLVSWESPLRAAPKPGSPEQDLAVASPLDARAYFARGMSLHQTGDMSTAKRLVNHSLKLDPRLAEARLWLAMRYLADGQTAEGIEQLAIVYRLRSNLAGQLAAILAEVARDRGARQLIADRLKNTRLILEVLRQASANLPPDYLKELVAMTDLAQFEGGVAWAQRSVTAVLLERGDYHTAHSYWRAMLPGGRNSDSVFNGDFAEIDAAPPFNWAINLSADLSVAHIRTPIGSHLTGLELRSFASTPVIAAEQLVLLPAGVRTLRALVRAQPEGESGFGWRIKCRGGRVLLDVTVSASEIWEERSWDFRVPEHCFEQLVQLRALGSGTARGASFQITGVSAGAPAP